MPEGTIPLARDGLYGDAAQKAVMTPRLPAPVAVFPASRQPHRGENKPRHRIGLREIAPELAGLRIDVFRQKPVAIAMTERIGEQIARGLALAERPERVDQPEP